MLSSIVTVASCIKGIVIRTLVQDCVDLLASGEVPADETDQRLTAEDREMLAQPVLDADWYDLGSYRRLTELMRDFAGKGDPLYIKRRGAAVAERLVGQGVFQQVENVRRVGEAADVETALSNLKLTATLWNSFFNFGSWDVFSEGTGRYGMKVKDSHDMPEVGWQAIHGFMERLAQEAAEQGATIAVARRQSPEGEVIFVFG